jgi:hypothetical protein
MVVFSLGCAAQVPRVAPEALTQDKPTASAPAAEPRAGSVANRMSPGDPIAEVLVAGFADAASAVAFVAASFAPAAVAPRFTRTLRRGESVRFADAAPAFQAAYLVVYAFADGVPVLLAVTRAHADVPLAIGSCGYQPLLGVDASEAGAPSPAYAPR